VIQVQCGSYHASAITASGKLYTWGHGGEGRLGHGEEASQVEPVQVEQLSKMGAKVHRIALGRFHSCAWSRSDSAASQSTGAYGRIDGHATAGAIRPEVSQKPGGQTDSSALMQKGTSVGDKSSESSQTPEAHILQAQVTKLKAILETQDAKLLEQNTLMQKLHERNKILETDRANAGVDQERVSGLESEIFKLKALIDQLQLELTDSKARTDALEAEKRKQQVGLEAALEKCRLLETEKECLKTHNEQLEDIREQQEEDAMQGRQAAEQMATMNQETERLQEQVKNLEEAYKLARATAEEETRSDKASWQNIIVSLEKQLEEAKQTREDLTQSAGADREMMQQAFRDLQIQMDELRLAKHELETATQCDIRKLTEALQRAEEQLKHKEEEAQKLHIELIEKEADVAKYSGEMRQAEMRWAKQKAMLVGEVEHLKHQGEMLLRDMMTTTETL